MDSLHAKLLVFLTSSATTGIGLLTNWPPEYMALVVIMALDVVTGVLTGFKGHRVHSNTLKKGLVGKVGIAIAVCLIRVLEAVGIPGAVSMLAVYGFIGVESLSVIENLALLGVPIPEGLKKRLAALSSKSDASANGTSGQTPKSDDDATNG